MSPTDFAFFEYFSEMEQRPLWMNFDSSWDCGPVDATTLSRAENGVVWAHRLDRSPAVRLPAAEMTLLLKVSEIQRGIDEKRESDERIARVTRNLKKSRITRGRRRRAIRVNAGATVPDIAAELEVSASLVYKWEEGKRGGSRAQMKAYRLLLHQLVRFNQEAVA